MPGGVEIVEFRGAGGQPRRAANAGSRRRNADGRRARHRRDARAAENSSARPSSRLGGAPVITAAGAGVVVQDPAGHFVELVQPGRCRRRRRARTRTSSASECGTRSRTSSARSRSIATRSAFRAAAQCRRISRDADRARLARAPARHAIPFRDAHRADVGPRDRAHRVQGCAPPAEPASMQDPGSTRIQLRVADIDAAVAALTKPAARSSRRAASRSICPRATDAQGRHRARSRRPVPRADSGAARAALTPVETLDPQ